MTMDELAKMEQRLTKAITIRSKLQKIKEDKDALPRMDGANVVGQNHPNFQSYSTVETVNIYRRAMRTALDELEAALRKELAEL